MKITLFLVQFNIPDFFRSWISVGQDYQVRRMGLVSLLQGEDALSGLSGVQRVGLIPEPHKLFCPRFCLDLGRVKPSIGGMGLWGS